MRVRLGEAAMVPDDFRSTDTVRFPTCLDGLRKHFLDITRVLDAADVDFWRHSIRGAEMDAADTAKALIEVLLERDVPDTVQLNLILSQVKAATLDDEFGLGQGVLRKGQWQRKDCVAFSVGPENLPQRRVLIRTAMVFGGDGGYDVMVSACYGFVRYYSISIVVIIILIISAALFTMLAKIATAIICKLTGFPA